MVKFGQQQLEHVLSVQTEKARMQIEYFIPGSTLAYRSDSTSLGESELIVGEIRETIISVAAAKMEMLRRLCDGTARILDFEDGSASFNALLSDPEFELDVEDWFAGKYQVAYRIRFLKTA